MRARYSSETDLLIDLIERGLWVFIYSLGIFGNIRGKRTYVTHLKTFLETFNDEVPVVIPP